MSIGRAGWFGAVGFWCGFALLVAGGRDADVWVRAVIWTGVALLSVATLRWWRPGLTTHLPARIRRWMEDEASEPRRAAAQPLQQPRSVTSPLASDAVASTQVVVVSATGEETLVTATLGRPYRVPSAEWRCPVWLTPLHDRLPDMAGEDSLQALCLAASTIRGLLEDVVGQGGRVLDPSSRSAYAIAAAFGAVGASAGERATQ